MIVKLCVIIIYCRNKVRGLSYLTICSMHIPSPPKSDRKNKKNR